MRGEVLHFDETQGFGFITAQDGQRYTFRREDLRRDVVVSKGMAVEFEAGAGQARGVFPIRAPVTETASPAVQRSVPVVQSFGRNATAPAAAGGTGMWDYFWRSLTANYANFRDRARRKEYWSYVLFWLLGVFAFAVAGFAVDAYVGGFNPYGSGPIVFLVLAGIFFLATLIPGLALCIRRLHDIGLSGWFYLLVFLPYVGTLIMFVFSLIPSQKHDNKWGPVPEGVHVPPPFQPATPEDPAAAVKP